MRNARRWLAGAACVIAVAACSSEPDTAAPTLELSTTTVTTLPPTTITTEAPTTTIDPRIAEVEAAVAAFHEAQLQVLLDPEQPVEALTGVATGDLLRTTTENIEMSRADGRLFVGEFRLSPISTVFEDDGTAVHAACVFDEIAVLGPDGSTIVEADSVPVLLEYSVQSVDDVWLPATLDFLTGSELPCEF